MKMNIRYYLLVFVAFIIISCDDNNEENKPKGKYEKGAFIVNEGQFGSSNGTITYVDPSANETEQNIIKSPGLNFIGDVVQSLAFEGDNAFIVINNDNKILLANANTFESVKVIEDDAIILPRYVKLINGKAYISVWGNYDANFSLVDSYILVYDIDNNSVVKKIDTPEGVERLLCNGQYLFASNYNYGGSDKVSVINTTNNTLVTDIGVGAGPDGMVLDSNNKLWVMVTGLGDDDSKLVRINTSSLEVEQEIPLNVTSSGDLVLTSDKTALIYRSGKNVYKMNITATDAPQAPLFVAEDVTSAYSLDINPSNGDIYIGDALNFASAGKVYVYSAEGSLKTTYDTGISPTQVVFR